MDEFSDDEGIDVEFEPDLLDEVGISKIFSFVFDWLHIWVLPKVDTLGLLVGLL